MFEWLYYTSNSQDSAYTEEPNGAPNIERLIAGLPAYRAGDGNGRLKKATLIVQPGDLSDLTSKQSVLVQLTLNFLQKPTQNSAGHEVYIMNDGELCVFTMVNTLISRRLTQQPFPSIQRLCEQLDKSAMEIVYVERDKLLELCNFGDHLESWQGDYKELHLESAPISDRVLEALLEANASQLMTLHIQNCADITRLPTHIALPQLKHLSLFNRKFQLDELYSDSYPQQIETYLHFVLTHLDRLETLTWDFNALENNADCRALCQKFSSGLALKHLELRNLQPLWQPLSNIPMEALEFLALGEFAHESELGLPQHNFSNLKVLELSSSWFQHQGVFQQLLSKTPKLEVLKLLGNIEGYNIEESLRHSKFLKELHLEIDDGNSEAIGPLIKFCPQIEIFVINNEYLCVSLFLDKLIEVAHLKKIISRNQYLNGAELGHLYKFHKKNPNIDIQFNNLSNIDFDNRFLSMKELFELKSCLKSASEINFAIDTLNGLNFNHIEAFEHITTASLMGNSGDSFQKFLRHISTMLPNLKKLDLQTSTEVTAKALQGLSLDRLGSLNLSKVKIRPLALQVFLKSVPALKVLVLSNDQSIKGIELQALKEATEHSPEFFAHYCQEKKYLIQVTSTPKAILPETSLGSEHFARVDAHTSIDRHKKHTFEASFVGKQGDPKPMFVRQSIHNGVAVDPQPSVYPFILSYHQAAFSMNAAAHRPEKSNCTLWEAYQARKGDYYFGRVKLQVTQNWQNLPSIDANETLEQYYLLGTDAVEILKPSNHSFYQIRLNDPVNGAMREVILELIIQGPKKRLTIQDLPEGYLEIVRRCHGFRDENISEKLRAVPASQQLDFLVSEGSGACRHRAIAAFHQMQKVEGNFPIQIISNSAHAWVEVFHTGKQGWISCDLGGHPTELDIQRNLLPEYQGTDEEEEVPEEIFTQLISSTGKKKPAEYFQRMINLSVLSLEGLDHIPANIRWHILNTLSFENCHLSAAQLNCILAQTPNLRTLTLKNCHLPIEEFQQLDFSLLTEIEHVTLEGAFVSDRTALDHLMQTTPECTKWRIENALLDENEEEEEASQTKPERTDIQFQKTAQPRPKHRYFPKVTSATLEGITSFDKPALLVENNDSQALRIALSQAYQSSGRPYYYVNNPSELRCAGAYIKESTSNAGKLAKGPGGPLVEFMSKHPAGLLLINYDRFKPENIARQTAMFDDTRMVDGSPIPQGYQIIGLINPSLDTAYQGADFDSRFNDKKSFNMPLPPANIWPIHSFEDLPKPEAYAVIELNGSPYWQGKLLGSWQIEGKQFQYRDGELIAKLKDKNTTGIVINNPPKNDPDFERFWQDFQLHQGVFARGKLLAENTSKKSVYFAKHEQLKGLERYFLLQPSGSLAKTSYPLNQETFIDFLSGYHLDLSSQSMFQTEGLLSKYPNQCMEIYLSQTLDLFHWMQLLEEANKHHVTLNVRLAPEVSLPVSMLEKLGNPKTNAMAVPEQAHSEFWVDENALNAVYPAGIEIIDVSDLKPFELLGKLNCQVDEVNSGLFFDETPSLLKQALKDNKTVILKGEWPNALKLALHPLLLERSFQKDAPGKLILVDSSAEAFPFLSPKPSPLHHRVPAEKIHIKSSFEARLTTVETVLEKNPFVFLTGPTGVGKTEFIQTLWRKKHPNFYHGEDQMLAWAQDKTPGIKTLFIDEANITQRQWSELEGLFNTPPGIFIPGHGYIELDESHKVIFAGNPNQYGGERIQSSFFKHHTCEVAFEPIPLSPIINACSLNNHAKARIFQAVDYLTDLQKDQVIVTPREIVMIIELTKATQLTYPELNSHEIAAHFTYELLKTHVPKTHQKRFDEQFKPVTPLAIAMPAIANLTTTRGNTPAISALLHQLNLRALRCKKTDNIASKGGLGGVVLEGEPGIGKSLLVRQLLLSQGLLEGKDFIEIAVANRPEDKEKALLEAFHQGKIVIMNEVNASPMSERLLNALLEGHDLNNKPSDNPGFMLIGTQNPTHFRGRIKTTLPLKHRLQIIEIPPYTKAEMLHILKEKGLPPKIRSNIIEEFLLLKKDDPSYCFRHVLKAAERWQAEFKTQTIPRQSVTPQPQVGEMCKLVSIANIEAHYAKQFGFPPIPLRKNQHQAPLSIREVAKHQGSLQGELLEFKQWQETLSELGYQHETIDFKEDVQIFIQGILNALDQGELPMIAFSVNKINGQPDPTPEDPEKTEHAAVITAYDPNTDIVELVHWGKTYQVDLLTLFNASLALTPTRSIEGYRLNPSFTHENKADPVKYLRDDQQGERHTFIPGKDTGFRAKLLIVKQPSDELIQQRQALFKKDKKIFQSVYDAKHQNTMFKSSPLSDEALPQNSPDPTASRSKTNWSK